MKDLTGLEGSSKLFRFKLGELLSTQREYLGRSERLGHYPRRKKEELMRRFRIYDALQEFRKRRGYTAILDRSAIADSAIIIPGFTTF